jgi:hypothetical protein
MHGSGHVWADGKDRELAEGMESSSVLRAAASAIEV